MADATAQYEADQQRLREQAGLDDDGLDVNPEDFQAPEVNPEIYKDVEPILFRGFLTTPATVNGVTFVFKSLNHHEFERLSLSFDVGRHNAASLQRYYATFLAYGVALVDGVNVLKNRDEAIGELADFFGSLPKEPQQRAIRYMSEVNRRANRAIILVEPFAIENRSRLRWVQVKDLDLTSTAVTGFEGTHSLGLNWGQLTWRAINQFEDLRENAEREWENAKFVASAMAGKGMQRIYNADKRRRQETRREQFERREKVIRYALLNEPIETQQPMGHVKVARSVAELTDQLERDLKGEKDWHDRVIDDHNARLRAELQQRKRAAAEARAAHLREYGDRPIIASTDVTGLSRADVQKRVRERQAQIAESLATQAKYPELTDPKYGQFSEKWLEQPIVRNAPSVMPATTRSRQPATPFRRGF